MRKVFVMIAALALVVASCKKDDDASKTLNYKGAIVKEFKMYVGSDEGGKEIVLSGVTPEKYWASSIASTEAAFKDTYIKFEGNKVMFSGDGEGVEYKFVADTLMVYEGDGWKFSALGSTNRLEITSGRLNIMKGAYSNRSPKSHTMKLEDGLELIGYSELSDMKNITDTIVWANFNYVFE